MAVDAWNKLNRRRYYKKIALSDNDIVSRFDPSGILNINKYK